MSPAVHSPDRNARHRDLASRVLRILLWINGAATIAAAIVLALAPATIPQMVGIDLPASQNLLAYLLAASELAVGSLCLLALRSGDIAVLRLPRAS